MNHATNGAWLNYAFFENLANKELVERKRSSKGGKQTNKRMTVATCVSADGLMPLNPVVI